jgi:sulfur relay (sulfurtransferase) complex TusBCD TusD component (DsrE family)
MTGNSTHSRFRTRQLFGTSPSTLEHTACQPATPSDRDTRLSGTHTLVRGGEVACCGTCMDARAITQERLVEGARRSTLEELTDWTLWADETLVF